MAKAVRRCVVCRKFFAASKRRKTCSDECHFQLASTISKELRTNKADKPNGKVVKKKNPGHSHWEPSPEYIREQCALIRAGILKIDWNGNVTIEPSTDTHD